MKTILAHPYLAKRAFSLIEVMVAAAMVALFLSAIFVVNAHIISLTRAQEESVTASQALQDRMEQIRSAEWSDITTATQIQTDIMNTAPNTGAILSGVREELTVTEYPAPATPVTFQVIRTGGTVSLNPASPASLTSKRAVSVTLRLQWTSSKPIRTRVRENTTILADGGIQK